MSSSHHINQKKHNSIEVIYPELINQFEDNKCAEIYSTKQFNFYIVCSYCNIKFLKLKPFAIHVRTNHLQNSVKVHNSLKKSKNEEPTISKTHLTKTPIKDQKITSNENENNIKKCDISLNSIDNKQQISSNSQTTNNNNVIPKPRIKIVLKSGQYFTPPVKKKKYSTKEKLIEANFIECGFGNCKRMFPNLDDLEKHKIELHSSDPECPYKCKDCNKTFKRYSNLHTHVRRFHLRERRFKCDYCDKKFFERTCKLKHELIHTGEKPCICEICGERFQVTHKLNMHVRSKHELPQFECTICHKLFHNKENLTIHMVCHSSDLPFECNICLKRFPRKRSYVKHLTTHSTDRDYVCRLCGKDFTSQVRISCHMKSHGLPYKAIHVLRKSKLEYFEPYEVE